MHDNRNLLQKVTSAKDSLSRKVRKLELVLKRVKWAVLEFDNIGFWEARHIASIVDGHFDSYPSQYCMDCKGSAEWYMVKNEVWRQALANESMLDLVVDSAKVGGSVYLCLSCLSSRIDRPVEFEDFADVPANELLFWAKRKCDAGIC